NVEKTLGNVVERLKILESGENATLKRKLDKTETRLAWARMEHDTAERSLHESTERSFIGRWFLRERKDSAGDYYFYYL
ncbi:hypothetical protein Tco_1520426, partial [Tanacetum coccineum]